MTGNSTHRKALAKALATQTGEPYQTAHNRVVAAAEAGLLPARFDGPGQAAALRVLLAVVVEHRATAPEPAVRPCPKCGSGPFEADFDVTDWSEAEDPEYLTVTVRLDGTVTGDMDPVPEHDSDSFVSARCLACGLSLVNGPGETRLRRAVAKQAEPGGYADAGFMGSGGSPDADLTDAQEQALDDLTRWLCDVAVVVPAADPDATVAGPGV